MFAIPAAAQQKPGPDPARGADRSSVGMRSVTGTVKKATEKGLVVVGRETGQKDKEWAFVIDAGTLNHGGNTPAIALTGYVSSEERDRLLAAGFQAHVHKPVEPAEIVAVVAALATVRR